MAASHVSGILFTVVAKRSMTTTAIAKRTAGFARMPHNATIVPISRRSIKFKGV